MTNGSEITMTMETGEEVSFTPLTHPAGMRIRVRRTVVNGVGYDGTVDASPIGTLAAWNIANRPMNYRGNTHDERMARALERFDRVDDPMVRNGWAQLAYGWTWYRATEEGERDWRDDRSPTDSARKKLRTLGAAVFDFATSDAVILDNIRAQVRAKHRGEMLGKAETTREMLARAETLARVDPFIPDYQNHIHRVGEWRLPYSI